MTTQYTPTLKLALPVTGELSGTWGDVVNDNITSMIEQAIAGLSTINTWTANAHTLTTANGTTSESRCAMLVAATGAGGTALTGAGEIICPAAAKLYVVQNTTAFVVTLKTSAGTGVAVAAGDTAFLFCDATNVNSCVTTIVNGNITGNLTVGGNATINGNTTLGNATSDTITATARFASDLVPSTDNARDLGSAANSWRSLWIDGTATMALVAITGGTIDGVSIGSTTAATIINVDNLRLDGNTISSTDTNGNVVIAPNGTGDVQLDADTVRVGDAAAAATLTSNGAGALTVTTGGTADLTLSTNAGVNSGTVVIANGVNGNITLTPNGTGDVILSADRVQMGDSNTDTTLTTNGTGNLNLTTNDGTNSGTIQIAQGINGNITLTPNGTGSVSISKLYSSGNTTLGATTANTLSVAALVNSNLLFTDATYDIGASGATRPRDLFLSRNLTVGGTLTLTGGVNLNGNVTVGDASTDTLTINSTITSNLIFTDNTYDIGASGATRPRNLYLAGTATIGGNTAITGTLSATAGTSVATSSGYLTVGTVSATGMNASDIGIPNNKYLRGTVVAGTSSVALIGLDSGNIVQINANDSSGGTNITGNLGLGGTVNSYGSQTTLTLSGTNVSRIDFRSNSIFTGTILSYQAVTEGLRLQTEAGYPIAFYPAGTLRASISAAGVFSTTLGATIQGLTVGLGAGAVATNTAVGKSALAANVGGLEQVAVGQDALLSNQSGSYNTAVGLGALKLNVSGSNNTALGYLAIFQNTASGITAVGYSAGYNNTSGIQNVYIGPSSGYYNQTGTENTFVGFSANGNGTGGSAGSYNTAVGRAAMNNNYGSYNTAVGNGALQNNTSAQFNTAVGYSAMVTNQTGAENCAFGLYSLRLNLSGSYNSALGVQALEGNSVGANNTAVGYQALVYNTASNNTAVGYQAFYNNTDTANNTALGYQAGYTFNGDYGYNTIIGYKAGYSLSATSNGYGNTFVGCNSQTGLGAGYYVTTGTQNVILGGFDGQTNLDIRTASNHIVLSDGAGNIGAFSQPNTSGRQLNSRGSISAASGAAITQSWALTPFIDNSILTNSILKIVSSTTEWQPVMFVVRAVNCSTGATGLSSAWWQVRTAAYNGGWTSFTVVDSGGDTGSFTLSISDATSGLTTQSWLQIRTTGGQARSASSVEVTTYGELLQLYRS